MASVLPPQKRNAFDFAAILSGLFTSSSIIGMLLLSITARAESSAGKPEPAPPSRQMVPPDVAQLIRDEIKKLRAQAKEGSSAAFDQKMRILAEAAKNEASAEKAYEQAVRAVEFAGLRAEGSHHKEWREANAHKIKAMRAGIRAHLEYLMLSLQAGQVEKIETLLPRLQKYADTILANPQWAEGDGNPHAKSIRESVFTKWLNLDALLPSGDRWHDIGAEADQIYSKTILPAWRAAKNPALLRYWDARIEREAMAARESLRDEVMEDFKNLRRPELLWERAKELGALGKIEDQIGAMIAVLRANTQHPRFHEWAAELETML